MNNPVAADDVGLDDLGIVYHDGSILLSNSQALTVDSLCGILHNGFAPVRPFFINQVLNLWYFESGRLSVDPPTGL